MKFHYFVSIHKTLAKMKHFNTRYVSCRVGNNNDDPAVHESSSTETATVPWLLPLDYYGSVLRAAERDHSKNVDLSIRLDLLRQYKESATGNRFSTNECQSAEIIKFEDCSSPKEEDIYVSYTHKYNKMRDCLSI